MTMVPEVPAKSGFGSSLIPQEAARKNLRLLASAVSESP